MAELNLTTKSQQILDNIHDVYNIIESMCVVYDVENTTLEQFLRDIRNAHSIHMYLSYHYNQK